MPFSKDFSILSVKLRETYFWLKPDAPKTNAFHVKDVVNIEPFLFDTMPPRWMPLWKMFSMWSQFFYSTMHPKWMPFSKDFLILSVKPIFCWNLMPPKPMPFMSKMLSTLNLFCLTQCPQDGCLYERCSQCEASSFIAQCTRNGCLSAKTFQFSAWNLFLVETWCPQNQCLSCQRCCQHWTFFVWHNAPKIDDAFMKDGLNVKPAL